MSDLQPLNYAPTPPMHRRGSFRRWFYAIVLLAIIAPGWWWAPLAWRRTRVLYWQQKCIAYTAQPDQVIYDQASKTCVLSSAWSHFYTIISPPGSRSDGTLFLHQMQKPNGERRLVVAEVDETNFNYQIAPPNFKIEVWTHVFKLGTFTEQPAEVSSYDRNHVVIGSTGYGTILNATKVYAAAADPADPTHFTFRTSDQNGGHIYDGWLQNDESVAIGERINFSTKK
jgi:hypothetical protein